MPRADVTLPTKSRYCVNVKVLARDLTLPMVPRYRDQVERDTVNTWWCLHTSETTRQLVVSEAVQQFRSILQRAAHRLEMPLKWAKDNAYCYMPHWSVPEQLNQLQKLEDAGDGYAEVYDGLLLDLDKYDRSAVARRNESIYDEDFQIIGAVEHWMPRWVAFDRIADRATYKTFPYLLARAIRRAYEKDRDTYLIRILKAA